MKQSFVTSKDLLNGINIMKYCRGHENYIVEHLSSRDMTILELFRWHQQKILWLQHERLIHLLVTILTTIIFLFVVAVYLLFSLCGAPDGDRLVTLVIAGVALVMLACYLFHYYRLENTVLHWYRIAEELHDRCMEAGDNTS